MGDDFMEPEEPEDENAIDDDFMAKVLDSQAEFAFTQEREARITHEGIAAETVNTLGKRGREEGDLEEDEEPIGLRKKRSRRIESDDEDDEVGCHALASKDKQTNTQSEGYMEGGESTQETLEAMVGAAEEASQARRDLEKKKEEDLIETMQDDMIENEENDDLIKTELKRSSSANTRQQTSQIEAEKSKSSLQEDNFDLSEECDFGAEEEKEVFEKYEQAAADVPSQDQSNIKTEEEVKYSNELFGASDVMAADVRMIPESDEDLFSQSSTHSVAQQPPPASQCSPIPEHPEDEKSEGGDSEVIENSQNVEEVEQPVDTSSWRFVTSNLSLEVRKALPRWIETLGCQGLHSKVDSTVTHLIVRTEDDLVAERTLKYLQAVASGVMVVSEAWGVECHRDSANLGKAKKWEVKDEGVEEGLEEEGPRKSREARELGEAPLLRGYEILLKEELEILQRESAKDLITRAGARPVKEMSGFNFGETIKIELVDSIQWMDEREEHVLRQLRNYRVATVAKDWLLDTICSHEIKPVAEYTLLSMDSEKLKSAGFGFPLV